MKEKMFFLLLVVFLAILFIGSAHMDKKEKNRKNAAPEKLPECAAMEDVERYYGQKVSVKGLYEVDPIAGSKRLQAVCIVLPDGTRLLRSYRPIKEEFRFINKQVIATGTVFTDAGADPHVQQVMAPHITNIESIVLAPGETPYKKTPRELPPLPVIKNREELINRRDCWVQLVGKLLSVSKRLDENIWADADFRLQDGTILKIEWAPYARWRSFAGQETTVTVRINIEKEEKGIIYISGIRTDICAGTGRD
ncbi:MAG: hypothetical protein KAW12_17890 [Candidatus Aminicenantes bacterium]|nr:hypothetical protein [Candidatus Aminicenantes bacterium]